MSAREIIEMIERGRSPAESQPSQTTDFRL